MKRFLKSLFFILLFIIILIFPIIGTKTGHKIAYFYIGDQLSQNTHLHINVESLDFHHYPQFQGKIVIEDAYLVTIKGVLTPFTVDLDFDIESSCITTNFCRIDDDVAIDAKAYGSPRAFEIKGQGEIVDGNITFQALRKEGIFENIDILLQDVNTTKLFTTFKQKPLLNGKANAKIFFDTLGKKKTQGEIFLKAVDQNYSGLNMEVTLDSHATINNQIYLFDANLTLPSTTLTLFDGRYSHKTKYATAHYQLAIDELSTIKPITTVDARGAFFSTGTLLFDKRLKLQGTSQSLGGNLDIRYEKKKFSFLLKDLPFENIMQRLKQNPLLNAKVVGEITYDIHQKELFTKTDLKEVVVVEKALNEMLKERFDYDLNQTLFNESTFHAHYKENILTSSLEIANAENHFIFNNTTLSAKERSIDTFIDFKIDTHTIEGDLYARNDGYWRDTLDTYMTFNGKVEEQYDVKLNGSLGKEWMNIGYHLHSNRLSGSTVTVEDNLTLKGDISGPYQRLYIEGKGKILGGEIDFDILKVGESFKDIHAQLKDINATKLHTLLDLEQLPKGNALLTIDFPHFSSDTKKGTIYYNLYKGSYKTLPLKLTSNIFVKNDIYTFDADIHLDTIEAQVTNGKYDANQSITQALYRVDIPQLKDAKPLLGGSYQGALSAKGEIFHHNNLQIKGTSKSFDGETEFLYKSSNAMLYIDFKDASFRKIMQALDYPKYLEAQTNGSINYDFNKELLLIDSNLDDAQFFPSELVDKAYNKAGINLLYERFDASTLKVKYQHDIIHGSLKLSNLQNHIYLTQTMIDTKSKVIDSYFDILVQDRELTGKIYGSLQKPEINLDMQKLIQHEMDKQIDAFGGQAPREMMESMPLGGTAKDVVTGTAGSFMKIFF